jgi:hypothetical protein
LSPPVHGVPIDGPGRFPAGASWQGHADVLFDADLDMAEHPGQLGILLRLEWPVGPGALLGECGSAPAAENPCRVRTVSE